MTSKVVLVTGPPGNGRDDYIKLALDKKELWKYNGTRFDVKYYHVFEYMQKVAENSEIPNLQPENVFHIDAEILNEIRRNAFREIFHEIEMNNYDNVIHIVSTPSKFRVRPLAGIHSAEAGIIDGISEETLRALKPDLIIVLIDDLLRVRERLKNHPVWRDFHLSLKDIAEWRQLAESPIVEYERRTTLTPGGKLIDWVIFSREHPISTFVDLVIGKKPRLYLSYHITGESDFHEIQRLRQKLSKNFICFDPYTIKDWLIVRKFDEALEKGNMKKVDITVPYPDGEITFRDISLDEIKEAIELIRWQIVHRDFHLIRSSHGVVVYHKADKPSYGVMAEIVKAKSLARPAYVIYPFKKRLSPFFEYYIGRPAKPPEEYIIQKKTSNESLETLEDRLVNKLLTEYITWPTLPKELKPEKEKNNE